MYVVFVTLDDSSSSFFPTPFWPICSILLGLPLSCKLKGRPFVEVVVRLSVCHGCIVAKRCKI